MRLEAFAWIGLIILLTYACSGRYAHGGDLQMCKTQSDGKHYWSWRQIDGKRCWYQGKSGKPKHELRWASSPDTPSKKAERPRRFDITPVAAPAEEEVRQHESGESGRRNDNTLPASSVEELLARAYDQLRVSLCCWPGPDLETIPLSQPKPPEEPISRWSPDWYFILAPIVVGMGLLAYSAKEIIRS